MKAENIIGVVVFTSFTVATCLLLLPRFRKFARWREGGAPMSLRSRIILPFFPACGGLAVISGSGVWAVAAIVVWLFGYISFLADRRHHS